MKRLWVMVLLVAGCSDARPQTSPPRGSPVTSLGSRFNPTECGNIQGRVVWQGPLPELPPFTVHTNRYPGKDPLQGVVRPRPNVPRVDPRSNGVVGAVVFLRGVELACSRSWDHQPVRVEQQDLRLRLYQGERSVTAAFVRRGDEVSMVSRDERFYSVHAEGTDFFTYTLAEKNSPRRRCLQHNGVMELSSGCGYYWMRGYLFVDDHPYYAHTDDQGGFFLPRVPPGRYQVVCWLPNWQIRRQDRDPESRLVSRIFLAPPAAQKKTIVVEPRTDAHVHFAVSLAAMPK